MSQFSFTCNLTGRGWAQATARDEDARVVMDVTFLTDALSDLADCTIALLSTSSIRQFTCSCEQEPGEHRWLVRRDGDEMQLRVMQFDQCFSKRLDEDGRLVFSTQCSPDS